MSARTRNIIIGFAIWAIVVAIIMYIDLSNKAKIEAQLDIEYPRIELKDSLDNIVKRTYLAKGFRYNPYFSRIELKDNSKATLGIQFRPSQPTLQQIIFRGTHIYKQAGCDTIWVQNISQSDTLRMFFLLRYE